MAVYFASLPQGVADERLHGDALLDASTVSRICAQLDAQVAQFRDRPLDHTAFP